MFIFMQLRQAYLNSLQQRSGYRRTMRVANQWINCLSDAPSRAEIRQRHLTKGHGDFQPGCSQANKELALLRSMFNYGIYNDLWPGENPTIGIRKWRTKRRKRICKFEEIRRLLMAFQRASTRTERRDRALLGLTFFTGARPSEARTALRAHIVPYTNGMGCWFKPITKTNETQELPIPSCVMRWIQEWLQEAPYNSPYLFPGDDGGPLSDDSVRKRWAKWRTCLNMDGLWSYDFRRTVASYLKSELKQSDSTIMAILNHYDGRALGHYVHEHFDSLCEVIQGYADWLWTLARADQSYG